MIGLLVALAAAAPAGWALLGAGYEADSLAQRGPGGKDAVFLRAVDGHDGALGQALRAERFRGRRVRLTAWLRAQEVADRAGIWLRVDGQGGRQVAADDEGTRTWVQRAVVLDVPGDATQLSYGLALHGAGTVYGSDFRLAPVSRDVPVTAGGLP